MTHDSSSAGLERILQRLLAGGVMTSSLLLAVGLVLWVVGGAPPIAVRVLDAGLVLLMCTPVLRVIVAFEEYVRHRDWVFAMATLVVLLMVGAGVVYALVSGGYI